MSKLKQGIQIQKCIAEESLSAAITHLQKNPIGHALKNPIITVNTQWVKLKKDRLSKIFTTKQEENKNNKKAFIQANRAEARLNIPLATPRLAQDNDALAKQCKRKKNKPIL